MTVVVKDVAEEERAIYARLQELAEQGAGRLTPDSLYAEVGVALRPCADHVVWAWVGFLLHGYLRRGCPFGRAGRWPPL
jgi:hypothetical protein